MNISKITQLLEAQYPNKGIQMIKAEGNEITQIICELEPAQEHPEWSRYISVIKKSPKHFHKQLRETYKILEGQLRLELDSNVLVLEEGEIQIIPPGRIHQAECIGEEVWVELYHEPGWTAADFYKDIEYQAEAL